VEVTNQPNVTYLNKAARRQLTVLFCDLVGSVEISGNLDVEDWYEFLRIYQGHCQEILQRYDGHIAQYLGDGLLVYFGYPVAHENSQHRAVTAALEILKQREIMADEIRATIDEGQEFVKVDMRIAIHTGPVVMEGVGEQQAQNFMALGVTPAIAARLQDKAPPNSVIISEATYELVRGSFHCESLGEMSLKGVSGEQAAYVVKGDRGIQTRFEVACETGLTPFISRDQEMEFLEHAWQDVKSGSGRLVLLSGDPGIGKSRLTKEFSDRHMEDDCLVLACQCSPYHRDSALYPLIEMVKKLLGIGQGDTEEVKLEKVQAHIDEYGFSQSDTLPLIAGLLSIPFKSKYPDLSLPANLKTQQDFQKYYSQWFIEQAKGRPIYFLIEDYHWVDPSTDEFLKHMTSLMVDLKILILITFRPEVTPPWEQNEHIHSLSLGPLPSDSVKSMIKDMWNDRPLSDSIVDQIVQSTDGVPLFIEESIHMATSRGEVEELSGQSLVIPSTLQDLLLARLDRVGEAKHLAQLAATIGREFSYDLLAAISSFRQEELEDQLNKLIAAGLICVVDDANSSELFFKHALIRDIAYQSLLASQTKKIHRKLAEVLCELFPEYKRTQPEIIAYHLTRAASFIDAIDYWKLAGRRAIGLHAHSEAASHLGEALELIDKLPEDDTRKRIELELNTLMGGRMIVTQGYGEDKVEAYYSRALQLAEELEDSQLILKINFGLEGFHLVRGNFATAIQHLDECMRIATELGDQASILKVYWSLGEVYFHLGDQGRCQSYLQQCLQLYSDVERESKVLQDPGVMGHIYMSWTNWISGSPDQSMQSANAAISLAEEINHPLSKAIAYCMYGGVNLYRGEYELALNHADVSIRLCEERGFQFWWAYSLAVRGRALASLGKYEEGINEIRKGRQMWEATGTMVTRPYFSVLLAESLDIAGRTGEALEEVNRGLEVALTTGEGYYLAEVHRVRGLLTLKLAGEDEQQVREAEHCFQQAIELAREQGAGSFELRAEKDLANLRIATGKTADPLASLRTVYERFEEGFETRDLVEVEKMLAIG